MNRILKFRAWSTELDEMLSWDSVQQCYGMKMFERQEEEGVFFMQSTGLCDKNGKEIYEGDIVIIPYVDPMGKLHSETPNGKATIIYEHGRFALNKYPWPQDIVDWCKKEVGEYISNEGHKTIVEDNTVLEVIGNIWENPELLKG